MLQKRRQALRVAPLGKDRFHNRYWVFHESTPGLYVEKGSLHDHMDYSVEEDEETKVINQKINESKNLPKLKYGMPGKGRPKVLFLYL